jgi:hypothetical protein
MAFGQNNGGNGPGGNSGEVFDAGKYEESRQSIDPALVYKEAKERVCDKYKGATREMSDQIAGTLMGRPILASFNDELIGSNMKASLESKHEDLYAAFIHDAVELTLNRNKDFSDSLMQKAADELPRNAELRGLYEQAYLMRKDPSKTQELVTINDRIEAIFQSYSLVFAQRIIKKSLGLQADAIIKDKLYRALSDEQRSTYDAGSPDEQLAIMDQSAKDSNDPELQKEWEEEKAALEEIKKEEKEEQKPKEEPKKQTASVQSKPTAGKKVDAKTVKAYEQANTAVLGTGYTVDRDGVMKLSPEINVQIKTEGEGQYSIIDSRYSSDGKIGPFDLKDLPAKAYERYIDNYVSRRVGPRLSAPAEIAGIRDGLIEGIGVALIGDGSKKGYKITGEDKTVLDNLVESLLVKDPKHELFRDKVEALYDKFGAMRRKDDDKGAGLDENAAMLARRKLLETGEKYAVTELLGQKAEA